MRRLPAITVGLIALLAICGVIVAAGQAFQTNNASAGVTPAITLSVDCDLSAIGVQSDCSYPDGSEDVHVGVVLYNTGPSFQLNKFSFTLMSRHRPVFVPSVYACQYPYFNCNPDTNDSAFPGPNWLCGEPFPDDDIETDSLAYTSLSFLSCWTDESDGPTLATGSSLLLATAPFEVTGDVAAFIEFESSAVYSVEGNDIGSCNPVVQTAILCAGAAIQVGDNPTTPTFTPTYTSTPTPTSTRTSTPTNTPVLTPSGTPTGAVTDIVALNQSICITAGAFYASIPAVDAAFGCQGSSLQEELQILMECVHHRPYCPQGPPFEQILQQVSPVDFGIIDRDLDQIHAGQLMMIAAFVDGEYPVLFETEQGEIRSHDGRDLGQTTLCYSELFRGNISDPDCDPSASTVGDGVVVAKIYIDENVPPGAFNVRVTQGLVSQTIPINVVGIPASIVVESLDDKTSIATGAKPRTTAGLSPDIDACDFLVEPPFEGATSSRKTNLLVRVLDDQGTEVVGSLVGWTRDGDPYGPSAAFGQLGMDFGGAAIPQVPTWDLGPLGVGFVQTVCGGASPGTVSSILKFVRVLDPSAPEEYALSYAIESTGTPPPPTPTPTACAGDEDCDGVSDTTDNCGYYPIDDNFSRFIGPIANADQANNDGNFIDNSPPYAPKADDRTRADSDAYGDACDTDDDNDGLFDIDETGGAPCLAASGPTDPLKDDTDGDLFLDGAECAISTDPLDPSDKPPLSECGPPEAPLFGLSDRNKFCLYGIESSPQLADSDGDLEADGSYDICEIVSLNVDRVVNVADMGMLAFGIARSVTLANIDLNRDGMVNPADQGALAEVMSSNFCPKTFD